MKNKSNDEILKKEAEKKDKAVEASKKAVKEDAQNLLQTFKKFFNELLDFRADTDREETIDAIKKDIPFKGATAWILICSIFVASVGLNADSTAVVIGAMLISPLMGPILGIGLSVAINDIDTLRRSLINFGVMILLSVLTAFMFFWLFPLSEDTSELLARTAPDIRDVLIAFFGGLALIIARTKRGTIASVIFGVAIATALMPPLCTVGYGLAVALTDNVSKGISFASGALYLFVINTIFIALATFLTIKFLHFPMIRYANSKRRRRISQIAMFLAILAIIPAGYTFIKVLQHSNFKRDARNFIEHELEALPHADYIKNNAVYKYAKDGGEPTIEINSFGLDEIPQSTIAFLQNRMKAYNNLKSCELIVNQKLESDLDQFKYMEELRHRDSLDLLTQSQKIVFLEDKIKQFSKLAENQIAFDDIIKEIKINHENIEQISYANTLASNFNTIDTLSVFYIKWNDSVTSKNRIENDKNKLEKWLRLRLKNLDSIVVKRQL